MATINGTNFNDNDTFQFNGLFFQFFPRLDGTSGNDSISGFNGNDILNGLNGIDTLNGGAGADTMNGGDGNDTYFVDNVGDVILNTLTFNPSLGEVNDSLGGVDTVNSSVSYTLGASLENLNLTGAAAINGTGNAKNNVINGNGASNILSGLDGNDTLNGNNGIDTLNGGAGADTMNGGDGNDTYFVDNVGDVILNTLTFNPSLGEVNDSLGGVDTVNSSVSYTLGASLENLNLTGAAAINGTGNAKNNVINGNGASNILSGLNGNDTLNGNNGIDTLNGGAGADTMNGGDGNDTYFVDNVGDVILNTLTFNPSLGEVNDSLGGVDAVNSSVSYTLGASLENLNLTGAAAINGTGNAKNNVINGNGASNILSGLDGNDTLNGNNGIDTLNGGAGADTMNGGDGNDTYFVDNVGDVILNTLTFNPSLGEVNDSLGGVDAVNSSVSYTLGASLENLNLTGAAAINGTGNAKNNVINGNGASNILSGLDGNDTLNGNNGIDTLNGGAGADTMNGGDGNDTYFVDNVGDVILNTLTFNPSLGEVNDSLGGVDTVNSSVSYTLGASLENLNLTGAAAINGTGNAKNNVINGNGASNILSGLDGNDTLNGNNGIDTLNGGAGADTMNGGDGNDTYFVDNVGDVILNTLTFNPSLGEVNDSLGGVDTVNSSVSYTLGASLENLNLTGAAAINGTGNAKNNVINGNGASNILSSLDGNDTINGGAGNDVIVGGSGRDNLTGATGADRFDFNALSDSVVGVNRDVITDFSHAQLDLIDLSTLDANSVVLGNQAFTFIGNAAFSAAGQIRFDTVTDILQGNVDNFLIPDFEIGLTGVASLVATDFVL